MTGLALTLTLALTLAGNAADAGRVEGPVSGQPWSVVGPRTLGAGQQAIEGAVGWPGASLSYLRGLTDALTGGVRCSFVYGVEGLVGRAVAPGFKVQGLIKFRLFERERVSFALGFEPGPVFYGSGGNARGFAAFSMPVALRLGIAASSALSVALLLEAPMWVSFGAPRDFNLPLLTGVGVEYFLSSKLVLFVRTQMGPTLSFPSNTAEFTLHTLLGVGLRL